MPVIEIQPDVYWVGVNDRTTDLFESLWPIAREGVAYNPSIWKLRLGRGGSERI
jgi:flavorubredoxin